MESVLHELKRDLLVLAEDLKDHFERLEALTHRTRCIETAFFYGMEKKPGYCAHCKLNDVIDTSIAGNSCFHFVCQVEDRTVTMKEGFSFPVWCPLGWGQDMPVTPRTDPANMEAFL